MGSVKVTLTGGALGGTIQTADGVAGMVLTGAIDGTGDYVLGDPILITSLQGLKDAGITTDGNAFAVRQVTDFYKMAGEGAQLYLMLCPNTVTVDMMADNTYSNGAKKLLAYAEGEIKILGIMTDDTQLSAPTITDGLNEDVTTAAVNMAVLAEAFFNEQMPFRAVIGGTSYNNVPADLTNYAEGGDNNRTAILIGDTVAGDGDTCAAALGLVIGDLAALPVQRKISRVKNKSLPITAAYVGTKTAKEAKDEMTIIAGRGYITFKKYVRKSGFFFSGDPMLAATTDDYCLMARGRVIDKAHILAYLTFVEEVDDEVFVVAGKLDAGYCKWLEQQILNQINATMGGEISGVACYIDPAQNVISTNKLKIVLKVTPVGYATEIEVLLGFNNPQLA